VDQVETLDIGFLDPLLEPAGDRSRGADDNRPEARNTHKVRDLAWRPAPGRVGFGEIRRIPWMPGVSEYSSGWSRSSFEISTWVMPLKRARLPSTDAYDLYSWNFAFASALVGAVTTVMMAKNLTLRGSRPAACASARMPSTRRRTMSGRCPEMKTPSAWRSANARPADDVRA